MSWNYRVIHDEGANTYHIHEVYYKDDGSIEFYSENPVEPIGESLDELLRDIQNIQKDASLPVLSKKELNEYFSKD